MDITVPNLIQVDDTQPGWTRRPHGKGFTFRDADGATIRDKSTLTRLQSLVIPPAYQNVWICPSPNGHIQVTARDERGRKQYIYHPEWTQYQQARKFQKFTEFALELPALRQRARQHLRKKGWPREKVLALAMLLLDEVGMRIGNQQYRQRNETYGLTTLRRKHLEIEDNGGIVFDYKAKSGKYRHLEITNKKLAKLIKTCSALPGYEVFRYQSGGKTYPIDSSDVNGYIQEITGPYFSSKDFRTWTATVQAVVNYPLAQQDVAEKPQRKLEPCLVRRVAEQMGNTLSVCRAYYIHPAVRTAVEEETMPDPGAVTEEALALFDGELSREEVVAYQLIVES